MKIFEDLFDRPRAEAVLWLSALCLVLDAPELAQVNFLGVLVSFLGLILLLSRGLLLKRSSWLAVFAALTVVVGLSWANVVNHLYLYAYWALACALAVEHEKSEEALSRSARLLIGAAFLLAAGEKVLRGEFCDGSFMHGLALWDNRFHAISVALGGLNLQALLANQRLKTAFELYPAQIVSIRLVTSGALRTASIVLAWWTLLIEGAIGLSFVLPKPSWFAEKRDWFLMGFIVPTYLLAQVPQFGMILAVLGFAQCANAKMRRVYLAAFALLAFADHFAPQLVDAGVKFLL